MNETVKMLNDFLVGEGYVPTVGDDENIRFKCEGGCYILMTREDDPQYIRLCFPNFWLIESETEMLGVLLACNRINRRCKVVKAFATEDDTWLVVELMFENMEQFKPLFNRCIHQIQYAINIFRDTMKGLTDPA